MRVCVIEEELQREQFPLQRAIGNTVIIAHELYTVVGVLKGKEATEKKFDVADVAKLNRRIYVPLSCAAHRTTRSSMASRIDEITIKISSTRELRRAAAIIGRFLESAHQCEGFEAQDKDYRVRIAIDLLKRTQKTEMIFDVVMGCSAGISLIVGGIGIMNIMLANVSERRREVGIRRSVGARERDILKQFLCEALAICLLGGALGVLLGIGLTWGVSEFAEWKTTIAIEGIVLSLIVSLADGVLFGTYPAWKAAKMDPIEALRFE